MPRRLSRRAYLCILCLGDSISLHIYSFLVRRLNRRVYLCILVAGDSVAGHLKKIVGDSVADYFYFFTRRSNRRCFIFRFAINKWG